MHSTAGRDQVNSVRRHNPPSSYHAVVVFFFQTVEKLLHGNILHGRLSTPVAIWHCATCRYNTFKDTNICKTLRLQKSIFHSAANLFWKVIFWVCMNSTKYERNNAEQPLSCAIISDPTKIPIYSACYERKIEADVNCHTASQKTGWDPFLNSH